jgi:hypothetical protein
MNPSTPPSKRPPTDARPAPRRLTRRQWAICALPLLLGPVVGVVAPRIKSERPPACQMMLEVAFNGLQNNRLGPEYIATLVAQVVPKIDFELLARDAPARLHGDIELLARQRARLSAVIDPQHGPFTPADLALVTALGHVAAWLQEGCG